MRWPHALRSLEHRNMRLFVLGQSVSLVGSWMQSVAMSWLVWRLTHSERMLGLVTFLSQAPVFFLGAIGGSLADRFPRRQIVVATQTNALLQASILAAITFTGVVRPWMLLPLAAMLGLSYAFEIPARQALLADITGKDMPNAVALNSTIVNLARVLGPALAGYVLAWVGEAWCFLFNAISFLAVLVALLRMIVPDRRLGSSRGAEHLKDGLRYASRTRLVRALLLALMTSSFFGMPYVSLMPVIASEVLHGGPALLGRLLGMSGLGALLGAVSLLVRRDLKGLARRIGLGATAMGAGILGLSLSRDLWASSLFLVLLGFGFISQMAGTMTLLQALTPDAMRGRVIGLFSMLFTGTTPFGALLAGLVAARLGVTTTLGIGACVVLAASALFHLRLPKIRRAALTQHPLLEPGGLP